MTDLPDPVPAYITAYNTRDVDGMLATLDDSVVFRNLSGGEVSAETNGKDDFAELARMGATAFSERTQKVRHSITVGNTTLAEIDFTAVVAADLPNGWKAGQELAFSGRSLFEVSNGRITRIIDEA